MNYSLKDQITNIEMLLRDHPAGTTADITEHAVVFWDGDQLIGAHLSADEPGHVDEPFDVEDAFPDMSTNVDDWLAAPTFSYRPSLRRWLQDAPPVESGRL